LGLVVAVVRIQKAKVKKIEAKVTERTKAAMLRQAA
jgi:hypothetical protein